MSKLTTFNMPLGPVHVALEEPVYFNLTVEGETIRKVELWPPSATSSRTSP